MCLYSPQTLKDPIQILIKPGNIARLVYVFSMILDLAGLAEEFDVRPNGVLHIGAHKAEESTIYKNLAWSPVYWIEAQPELVITSKEQ